MQRLAMAHDPAARLPGLMTGALARRWYLTFKTRRAYSVRQVSPGDRRLLAQFTHELDATAAERERASLRELTTLLLDRVIGGGDDAAVAFVALENNGDGDHVIGACAYATAGREGAEFAMAVANSHRQEQVGRTLLSTLLREARRVGIRRLSGEMHWSNRPMQSLATSMGFQVLPSPRDRNARLLVLETQ